MSVGFKQIHPCAGQNSESGTQWPKRNWHTCGMKQHQKLTCSLKCTHEKLVLFHQPKYTSPKIDKCHVPTNKTSLMIGPTVAVPWLNIKTKRVGDLSLSVRVLNDFLCWWWSSCLQRQVNKPMPWPWCSSPQKSPTVSVSKLANVWLFAIQFWDWNLFKIPEVIIILNHMFKHENWGFSLVSTRRSNMQQKRNHLRGANKPSESIWKLLSNWKSSNNFRVERIEFITFTCFETQPPEVFRVSFQPTMSKGHPPFRWDSDSTWHIGWPPTRHRGTKDRGPSGWWFRNPLSHYFARFLAPIPGSQVLPINSMENHGWVVGSCL